jgi:predicted P-loop ATPase
VLLQFIMGGTTNEAQWMLDDENRRFWPKKVKSFDIAGLEEVADQLWAEAAHYETLGESIVLPRDLWPIAAKIQAERRVSNVVLDRLEPLLGIQR